MKRKTRKKIGTWLLVLLALLPIFVSLFPQVLTEKSPLKTELTEELRPPSEEHPFGTDAFGRDVHARVIYGTKYSVLSTFLLVGIIMAFGTVVGIFSGYVGGMVDSVIMRIADAMLSFPDMILAMAVAGILGPNLANSMIAIAVVSWTKYARVARSLVLKIKHNEYMDSAKLVGSTGPMILFRYLIPMVMPTIFITAATDIGTVMLSLASLSFLGFGIQPPTPEWGYMLSEGRKYFQTSYWLLLYPGAAMFIVVVIYNLLGDRIRDELDPKQP